MEQGPRAASTAARVIDDVVLVAKAKATEEAPSANDDERATVATIEAPAPPIATTAALDRRFELRSVRVLRERVYLLHCALLR